MRFFAVFLAGLFFMAAPASAQAWFTRDACHVETPKIHPKIADAAMMQRLDAEAAAIENSTGRLWQITSPAGAVSHLWATMHSTHPLILDLPPALRTALDQARVVASESDPTVYTRQQLMSYARGDNAYRLTPWPRFKIDDRVRDGIMGRLTALGFNSNAINDLMPAALFELILSDPCDDFTASVFPIQDFRILLLAREAGAQITGLESWSDVEATLNDPQNLALATALVDGYGALLMPSDHINESRSTYFALYLQGRIGHYMALDRADTVRFFGEKRGTEVWRALQGYLVDDRNAGFVRNALPILRDGGAVLAVGAYHLPGVNGMISLLRNEGFVVERVPTADEVP